MKKTTKVKKLTNALKRFVTPTAEIDDEPELAETMIKFVERLEALERKTDLMMGQMSNLSVEVRKTIQQFSRTSSIQPSPQPRPISPQLTPPPNQRGHGIQSKPLPRQRSPLAPLTPLSPGSRVVLPTTEVSSNTVQGPVRGRRDRLLHKAICADCSKDCEVPIKPTEGRPVYCKACFILRKASRTLPVKSNDRGGDGANPIMASSLTVTSQSVPVAMMTPAVDASMMRSSGHVPPQIHNLARRSAVAYMAKKAGHLPQGEGPLLQPSATASNAPSSKAVSRSRPVRNDRAKPKKRSR